LNTVHDQEGTPEAFLRYSGHEVSGQLLLGLGL